MKKLLLILSIPISLLLVNCGGEEDTINLTQTTISNLNSDLYGHWAQIGGDASFHLVLSSNGKFAYFGSMGWPAEPFQGDRIGEWWVEGDILSLQADQDDLFVTSYSLYSYYDDYDSVFKYELTYGNYTYKKQD